MGASGCCQARRKNLSLRWGAPTSPTAVEFWRALLTANRNTGPAEVLHASGSWTFVTGLPDQIWAQLMNQTLEITEGCIDHSIEVADRCGDAAISAHSTTILLSLLGKGDPWEQSHIANVAIKMLRTRAADHTDDSLPALRTRLIELGYHDAADITLRGVEDK